MEQLTRRKNTQFFFKKESSSSLNWNNSFSIGLLFLTLHVFLYTIETSLLLCDQHPWSVDLYVWASSIAGNNALLLMLQSKSVPV